jgi:hypothetical protein
VITNRATTIPTSRQRLFPIDRRFKLHGKLPGIDYANSMRYHRPPNAARTAHFTVHPEGTHPASHSIAFLSLDHRAQGNGRHSTPAALSYLAAHISPLAGNARATPPTPWCSFYQLTYAKHLSRARRVASHVHTAAACGHCDAAYALTLRPCLLLEFLGICRDNFKAIR